MKIIILLLILISNQIFNFKLSTIDLYDTSKIVLISRYSGDTLRTDSSLINCDDMIIYPKSDNKEMLSQLGKKINHCRSLLINCRYLTDLSAINYILNESIELRDLEFCEINNSYTFPDEFYNVSELNNFILDINSNIDTLPETLFTHMDNLNQLRINVPKLKKLPSSIFELSNLFFLEITSDSLTHIPKEIQKLEKLISLYLVDMDLLSLPEEITKCKNLTSLGLEHVSNMNNIDIQNMVFSITKLKELGFDSCKLGTISDDIINLSNLESLIFRNIAETKFNNRIYEIKSLKSINFYKSDINEINDNLCNLENLNSLCIMGTNIKCLPECISNLKKLKYLDVSNSGLSEDYINNLKHKFPNTLIR